MTAVLLVATPADDCGKILASAGGYLLLYREEAEAEVVIRQVTAPFIKHSVRICSG